MKFKFLAILSIMFLCSCYTIHFVKDEVSYNHYMERGFEDWHHIGVFGLMEFSSPVDLKRSCPSGQWNAVRTQMGWIQALVPAAVNMAFSSVNVVTGGAGGIISSGIGGALYTPEEVKISCKAL